MLTSLRKGRKNGVFEEPAAFQEQVNTHVQEQKNASTGTTETEQEEAPMVKIEKMHGVEVKMPKVVEVGNL